jgi:branched-chain amino acid transport system permease protein
MTHDHPKWWVRAVVGSAELALLVGVVVILVSYFGTATDVRILKGFLISLVGAVAVQAYTGPSGVISFGHVGFIALGAYGSALFTASPMIKIAAIPEAPAFILASELPFLPAILIAVAIAMMVAAVIGPAFVRLSGAAAAVATLGLMVVVYTVLSNADWLTRGSRAFSGIPPYATVLWCFCAAAFVMLAARLLRESDIGLGLRSSREDEIAAGASGVDVRRARYVAWVLSAGLAAISGALYAHFVLAILPHAFHFSMTFLIVTMVIVGGHSITGAVAGAAVVSLLAEILRRVENGFSIAGFELTEAPGLTTIVLALMIVTILTLRPQGMLGRWEIDELLARLARRRTAHEGRQPANPKAADSKVVLHPQHPKTEEIR